MKNISVFISGSGSNLKAIYKSIESGEINGKIVLVISSKKCAGSQFANKKKITTYVINQPNIGKKMIDLLDKHNIDLICLAGYLKLIPSLVIKKYRNRIINIHPALLPKFGGKGYYGMRIHESVIKANEKESGVSIHFVNEEYDKGLIIAQKVIKIMKNESAENLASRILKEEHKLYPKIIKYFCEDEKGFKKMIPLNLGSDEN